jgi:uncharacterized membrane protein YbhN (UPF0104 family)
MHKLGSVKGAIAPVISRIKPYIRWLILGGTLFFLLHSLWQNWQDVTAIRVEGSGWGILAIAILITLLAHVWAGWVWGWLLEELGYDALGAWSISVYLKTNIAKYLPGNVWHFYGRVMAARSVGVPFEGAAISVVMEPLLMATAALIIAFMSNQHLNVWLQLLGLCVGLTLIHPWVMNPILKKLAAAKSKLSPSKSKPQASKFQASKLQASTTQSFQPGRLDTDVSDFPEATSQPVNPNQALNKQNQALNKQAALKKYPILPLIGELIFLLLRGVGFIAAVMVVYQVGWNDLLSLLSAFSLSWMLGLVVPGAPGGIGVFEATALILLEGSIPSGLLLGAVAFYRLISTLAEAIGAGLAWGVTQLSSQE